MSTGCLDIKLTQCSLTWQIGESLREGRVVPGGRAAAAAAAAAAGGEEVVVEGVLLRHLRHLGRLSDLKGRKIPLTS